MADEKLNTGPAENTSPEAAGPITTPEQAAASEPRQEHTGPTIPEPGDVVVSFDKINELMAEKRQNARAEVEKAETPETPEAAAPGETPQPANTEEPKKPRRGRPPKAEKAATENQKAEKSAGARKGRPPKADKAAPDKPKPSKRDKVSRSDGKAPDAKEPIKPAQDTALKETAAVEQTAPEPTTPPRPVEEGKLVYLKLSEVHPFHTFRPHPFKVRDDAKMQEIVASIRVNGVMVPGLARPEKDGNGYEIVAGHRRTHGSELAGLEEMPFIVREMTDHEAVQAIAGASFTNFFSGTVDIEADRDEENNLVGIKECSKENYDRHTQKHNNFNPTDTSLSTVQKGESTPQLWLKDYADYGITYNEQSGGWYYNNQRIKILLDSEQAVVYTDEENGVCVTISRDGNHQISEIKEISETDAQSLMLKNNPIGEDYTSQE